MTSPGWGGVTPTGVEVLSSCANQDCSSGNPATGGLDNEASLRAARVKAERTSLSGRSSRAGYPEWKAITSLDALRIAAVLVSRGAWSAPRAAVCHP
jgi:hypothetical protein